MKTMLSVGLLALALGNHAFGQSNEPFEAVDCRRVAEEASKDLDRITAKEVKKAGSGKESRFPLDDFSTEVRDSEKLKQFLQCLSEQRTSLQK